MKTSQAVDLGICLALWLVLNVAFPARGADKNENPAEALFHKVGMASDTDRLLAYLRGRSSAVGDLPHINTLIRRLGSGKFRERQDASRRLVALGQVALPELQQSLKDRDAELAQRAKECIQEIERQNPDTHVFLPRAAVRLLVERRAKGTVEALVEYLPLADDPDLEEEIYYGLEGLAVSGGKVHPVLVASLADKLPARRAVAACLIGRVGDAGQKQKVRKLLSDKDPGVRLRAAQGLLAGKDATGVPALTGLLVDTPLEVGWQAEELLRWLGGDRGPESILGETAAERRSCRSAWEGWWRQTGEKVDWVALLEQSPRRPGLVLLPGKERLCLYGCDSKPRYEVPVTQLAAPWLLLPNRHLIGGSYDGKDWTVAEWDERGRAVWRRPTPSSAQLADLRRLANGSFLVLGERVLLTLDARGDEVQKQEHYWAIVTRNSYHCGRIGDLAQVYGMDPPNFGSINRGKSGCIGQIDVAQNKQLWHVDLGRHPHNATATAFAPLPEGRFLVALGGYEVDEEHRYELRQLDRTGQVLWSRERAGRDPERLIPLRNGNLLVLCGSPSEGYFLVSELDGNNRLVWEVVGPQSANQWFSDMQVVYPLVRFGFSRPQLPEMELDRPAVRLAQLASKSVLERRHSAIRLRVCSITCLTVAFP